MTFRHTPTAPERMIDERLIVHIRDCIEIASRRARLVDELISILGGAVVELKHEQWGHLPGRLTHLSPVLDLTELGVVR